MVKDTLKELLSEEDYTVIKDLASDNYKRLFELERDFTEKVHLRLEDDFYLGKIIFSYNLIKNMEIEDYNNLKKMEQKAKDLFVKSNMGLVINIGRAYSRYGMEADDLIQEGVINLITAAERYDYKRGYKFVTYATHWVKRGVRDALHNQSKAIRRPVHVISSLNRISESREKLTLSLGRTPSDKEISLDIGIPIENIQKHSFYAQDVISFQGLSANEGGNSVDYESLIPSSEDIEDEIDNTFLKESIKEAFKTLSAREVRVIKMRFGLDERSPSPQTLDMIGQELGITRERVRQIESKALRNLRHPSRSKFLKDYIWDSTESNID